MEGNRRPNLLVERSNQMAAAQLIIFNKDAMECGEIWVKQRNDSDVENGERFNLINSDGNKWRRIRRNRRTLKDYYRQFRFINWLGRKFHTTDRAKQADYLSRLIFPVLFLIFNCAYWLNYSRYTVPKPS
ncbi:unnamed protein product [Cercopithifilaria johnstoni]|uniref:Uncharacterized protein n=1 Tax=Cercopithifilaria johnstoni TaxID=2874296 RepID=A0A8J2MBG1_9BILA|nr:unnamed protein product [Cercopithifilaria johnstoni]